MNVLSARQSWIRRVQHQDTPIDVSVPFKILKTPGLSWIFELYQECFMDCLQRQAFADVTGFDSQNPAHVVIAELKAYW
jgi:hypothetical protein